MYLRLTVTFLMFFIFFTKLFAEQKVLKFHSFSPLSANSNADFIVPWSEKIFSESNGEIKIEIYPSMQLGGKPPQLVDQVREGMVDIIWTLAGYTPGRFPSLEVFDLPFIASNAEATSQAAHEFSEIFSVAELQDFKVLAVHVHSPGKLHTKSKAIENIDDFKGLKLRGPTRVITEMLESFGAVPVGMPVPEVAPSLSKGVIDGMLVPYEIMHSFKLHEITKFHSEVFGNRGLYTTTFLFLMNKASYEGLTDNQKKIIDNNSGINLAKKAGQLWDGFEIDGKNKAKIAGGKFFNLTEKNTLEIKEKGEKYIQSWIKQKSLEGIEGQKIYEKAKELIKKYEK